MTLFKEKYLLCSECLHFKESLNIDGLFDIVENMEKNRVSESENIHPTWQRIFCKRDTAVT